jgi:hypothetical protein
VSFYVSTATIFLLHCDEWDRVVALPRHKFVTGVVTIGKHSRLNRQIWYRHPNSEAGNDEIQKVNMDFYFVGITFFISQTDLIRTGIFSNSYNEMFKA